MVINATTFDTTSRRILAALDSEPRATVAWLAEQLSLARGTVQNRVAELFKPGALRPPSTVVRPESLGFGTRALVTAEVDQARLDAALRGLAAIPEVVECVGTAGPTDLLIQAVARDSDDLYRVGQLILACPGIRRTATSIVLRELIPYRIAPLF